jgi:hypothetical protein
MTEDESHFTSIQFAGTADPRADVVAIDGRMPADLMTQQQVYYQAEGYYYGYYAGLQGKPPKQAADGLAWVSIICGVLGWFIPLPLSIPAIICGHMSRSRRRRAGLRESGWALAGITLGWCLAAGEMMMVLALIAWIEMMRLM